MTIDSFTGTNFYLSNFYERTVSYNGLVWYHTEGAYQATKTLNRQERETIRRLSPRGSKSYGRRVTLRDGWDELKFGIMYQIVYNKFSEHQDLRERLLSTEGQTLIEGNNWGDRIWGQVDGQGENWLGKVLMQVREELT